MKSSFLIVTDRGNLKAYRLEKMVPGRPPRLHLVQALSFVEPHQRLGETLTDQAGAFGASEGAGNRHLASGIGERHLDIERDRRNVRTLVAALSGILREEKPGFWAFAAPSEIHAAVLRELDPDLRALIGEELSADLVNVPADRVLEHFERVGG